MLSKVLKYPNKILTTPTKDWDFNNDRSVLEERALAMLSLLETFPNGAALAANQAGFDTKMFVIKESLAEEYKIETAIVNPIIRPTTQTKKLVPEGCLSFPGININVKRFESLTCDYFTIDGIKKSVFLEDFGAQVFQHECEHLDGKLFIDNLDRISKYQIIGKSFKNR